jgi:hypothetical protein
MIWTILSVVWKPIAALLAILGIYFAGSRNARQKARAKAAEGYIETRKKADDAEILDDADLARRWLQSRDPNQR